MAAHKGNYELHKKNKFHFIWLKNVKPTECRKTSPTALLPLRLPPPWAVHYPHHPPKRRYTPDGTSRRKPIIETCVCKELAVAQAVICWSATAESCVRNQVSRCGIYG
jgi:hypothetical protein